LFKPAGWGERLRNPSPAARYGRATWQVSLRSTAWCTDMNSKLTKYGACWVRVGCIDLLLTNSAASFLDFGIPLWRKRNDMLVSEAVVAPI
jgi:hypothetical protein